MFILIEIFISKIGIAIEFSKSGGNMFCENCGKKLEKGTKFCIACGYPVREDSSENIIPIKDQSTLSVTHSPLDGHNIEKDKKRNIVKDVIIGILSLGFNIWVVKVICNYLDSLF